MGKPLYDRQVEKTSDVCQQDVVGQTDNSSTWNPVSGACLHFFKIGSVENHLFLLRYARPADLEREYQICHYRHIFIYLWYNMRNGKVGSKFLQP